MLAALCLGGAWLTSRYDRTPDLVQRTDLDRLRQVVRAVGAAARQEADQVLNDSSLTYSFGRLSRVTAYPTFVLRNGRLRYWSSAVLAPEADALARPADERLAELPTGQFLVERRVAGRWAVLVYVPLTRRYGISNRYLREGDETALFRGLELKVLADSAARLPRFAGLGGRYLFSVERLQSNTLTGQYAPLALLLLGSLLVVLGAGQWARRWARAGRAAAAGAALLGPLLALRAAWLYLGLPYSLIEWPLFDPRVYAASWLAPSLGDLLLNALLALLLAAGGAWGWQRAQVLARVPAPGSRRGQLAAGAGLALAFGAVVGLLFDYYRTAFGSTLLSLDVSSSTQVTGFRAVLALAVLLHTGAYLTVLFGLTQVAGAALRQVPRRLRVLGPLAAAGLALAVGLGTGEALVLLLGALALFAALVPALRLRVAPTAGSYQAGVLAVLLLALASAVGALALYARFEQQLLADKQRIANNLLVDNDLLGEFLLGERMRGIAADPFIRRTLAGPFGRTEGVRRRVARQYLADYFDKYESSITLYNSAGQPLGEAAGAPTLAAMLSALRRVADPTDQPGVFLLRATNSFSSRRYVAVATVGGPGVTGVGPMLGAVRVALTLKQLTAYSVLPELLVDQKFFQPGLATQLSYAGYDHGRLVYAEGDFDYARRLPPARLAEARLYTDGLVLAGFHHLAVRGAAGRTVVVTTATYSVADWLANFSFQFLLGALGWSLALGAAVLLLRGRAGWRLRLNFSTRIQLLLNVGIVVPLVVVSVATASQLIASYQRDLARTYERRGQLALESLRRRPDLLADTTRPARLEALVRNVAALTETDLNFYSAEGQLLASSQPLIFEAGLLGPLLNPRALAALREQGQTRALLTERAGSLSFSVLYVPVSELRVAGSELRVASGGLADEGGKLRVASGELADENPTLAFEPTLQPATPQPATRNPQPENPQPATRNSETRLIGYLGIPFFDSEKELNGKLTELFTTILNIFTVLFLLFLGLAFAAARQLTAPLKLLTEKLTRTSLTDENEPLEYRSSDDEIGLLVREYNAMLGKLEASKRALAAQEKEAAWREMARQVAHEIKNPLTPMKLSLQFLQKAIAERRPNAEELIGRISQTLITQIDVLTDIATSFSTFTNLPAMRAERLHLPTLLRRAADLFGQEDPNDSADPETPAATPAPAETPVRLTLPPDADDPARYVVFADENLLVRTLNNLFLNARQAIPEGRAPRIGLTLTAAAPGRLRVALADNGSGIAPDVRERVFLPNFTTKATGSGIGLAVAKRGIEAAGGSIWFETVVGEGTTFYLELPLAG